MVKKSIWDKLEVYGFKDNNKVKEEIQKEDAK